MSSHSAIIPIGWELALDQSETRRVIAKYYLSSNCIYLATALGSSPALSCIRYELLSGLDVIHESFRGSCAGQRCKINDNSDDGHILIRKSAPG